MQIEEEQCSYFGIGIWKQKEIRSLNPQIFDGASDCVPIRLYSTLSPEDSVTPQHKRISLEQNGKILCQKTSHPRKCAKCQ